jgi:hypothetical protein
VRLVVLSTAPTSRHADKVEQDGNINTQENSRKDTEAMAGEFRFIVKGDYLHSECEKCGEAGEVKYLGLDPTMPRIQVTCRMCGAHSIPLKIWKPIPGTWPQSVTSPDTHRVA